MKVINLFAPPSSGKSDTGKLLAGILSIAGYSVELVPEFAKFATYAKNNSALSDQVYMFAKQGNRLHVLNQANQLDFVIMDGPLPLAILYCEPSFKFMTTFEPLVMDVFNSYENLNFYIERNPAIPYSTVGRNESEDQARKKGVELKEILDRNAVQCSSHMLSDTIVADLFKEITGVSIDIPSLKIPRLK